MPAAGRQGLRSRCGGDRPGGWGAALISLSPPRREDQIGWEGLRFGGAIQWRAVYAARGFVAPAGAKGWEVVRIHQIASASRWARSTRAILAPRCLPRRVFIRW